MEAHYFAGSTSLEVPGVVRASSLMRSTNNNLRRLSGASTFSEPIAFFCECRSPACYSVIWIQLAAFDLLVAGQDGWLLVEGHEPSARWRPKDPFLPTSSHARRTAKPPARSTGWWAAPFRHLERSA